MQRLLVALFVFTVGCKGERVMDDKIIRQLEKELGLTSAYESEIPSRPVHVLDNGAMQEIADSAPLDADEMPDAYDAGAAEEPLRDVPQNERDEIIGSDKVRGGMVDEGSFRDDFVERLRLKARSLYGVRGEQLDDFDQKYMEQQGAHDSLVQQAPFVRSNPVSALQGTLGVQVPIFVGQQPQQTAYWQGEDAETTPVTVAFTSIVPIVNFGVTNALVRPYGIVQFGTRGFLASVEVDIINGAQLTIGASQVNLLVALEDTRNINSGAGLPTKFPPIQLAGMLSFNPCVRTQNLTRTKYIDNLVDPGSITIAIPPFARTLFVMKALDAYPYQLVIEDSNGQTIFARNYAGATDVQTVAIPLPGDAAEVTIATNGTTIAAMRLIFGLGI